MLLIYPRRHEDEEGTLFILHLLSARNKLPARVVEHLREDDVVSSGVGRVEFLEGFFFYPVIDS